MMGTRKSYKRSAEDKAARSERMKAYWAKVRADKAALATRTANMGTKSPEKVSKARKQYFENPENRHRQSEKKAAWWAAMTPEQRKEQNAHSKLFTGQSLRDWQATPEAKVKMSQMARERMADPAVRARLSLAAKRARIDHPERFERSSVKTKVHVLPSGNKIITQSSWEVGCADVLDTSGVPFRRGGTEVLGPCPSPWHPDFLVFPDDEERCFYLEVKGHPLARERFETMHLPYIHYSSWPVALLPDPPPYPDGFKALIAQVVWLHY